MESTAVERILLSRSILPFDYKRRQHYYQSVEMVNAAGGIPVPPPTEPAAAAAPAPAKP
jgi:hypothetical protein